MIRPATADAAAAVRAIYAFHVAHGAASFDTGAPDEAFWRDKLVPATALGSPFLLARHPKKSGTPDQVRGDGEGDFMP